MAYLHLKNSLGLTPAARVGNNLFGRRAVNDINFNDHPHIILRNQNVLCDCPGGRLTGSPGVSVSTSPVVVQANFASSSEILAMKTGSYRAFFLHSSNLLNRTRKLMKTTVATSASMAYSAGFNLTSSMVWFETSF